MADYNIIYTDGGGEVLWSVFNGIAATLNGSGKDSMLAIIVKLAAVIGGFWATISMILKHNPLSGFKWFAWFLFASEILFIPTVPVWIKDPVNHYERVVPNVPFGLAFTAGKLSQFGQILTEIMEQNYSVPYDLKYSETGSVFASRLLSSMDKLRITDVDFSQTMHNFVNQCIAIPSMIGEQFTVEELRQSKDIWTLVKTNSSKMLRFSYKDPYNKRSPAKLMTCHDGALELEKHLKEAISKVSFKFARINMPDYIASLVANGHSREAANKVTRGVFEGYMTNIFQELQTVSNDAETTLRQQMMINAIVDGSSIKRASYGGASNYAISKAQLQQKNTYSILGSLAKSLPSIKAVFEALIYGSFLFIMMFALLPGGHKIIITYFQTVAWLQMWAPVNAILHLIIMIYSRHETLNALDGAGGITLANSAGVIQVNEDMCAYAQNLSMMVPAISYFLLKGVSSFVHLASHIGSGYQAAAASTAGEVTSGNVNLGNIQYRVRSRENTSAFQQNTSPNVDMGNHGMNMPDGTLKRTTIDGKTIYTGGQGRTHSRFGMGVHASNMISSSLNKSINQEKSVMSANSKEFANQQSIAQKTTSDLIDRVSNGMNSGENYGLDNTTSSGKTISDTVNFSNDLQKRFGFTSKQAAQLTAAIAATAGGGVTTKLLGGVIDWNAGMNAQVRGQYETDAQRSQALDEVINFAKGHSYSQNLDSIAKATKDIRFGETQGEERALSTQIGASHDKMRSLRESNSISQQNIDRWSNAKSFVESNSVSINQNQDQRFLEYVSTRKEQGRTIGLDTARKMINGGFPEAQMYAQYFVRDVLRPEALKVSSSVDQGGSTIDNKYANTQLQQPQPTQKLQGRGEIEAIQKAGKKMITPVQNQDLKNESRVEKMINSANDKIKQRHDQNTGQGGALKRWVDTKYGDNLLGTAFKNIGNTNKDTDPFGIQPIESIKNLLPFQGTPKKKVKG